MLEQLPPELFCIICEHLPVENLYNLSLTSEFVRNIIHSNPSLNDLLKSRQSLNAGCIYNLVLEEFTNVKHAFLYKNYILITTHDREANQYQCCIYNLKNTLYHKTCFNISESNVIGLYIIFFNLDYIIYKKIYSNGIFVYNIFSTKFDIEYTMNYIDGHYFEIYTFNIHNNLCYYRPSINQLFILEMGPGLKRNLIRYVIPPNKYILNNRNFLLVEELKSNYFTWYFFKNTLNTLISTVKVKITNYIDEITPMYFAEDTRRDISVDQTEKNICCIRSKNNFKTIFLYSLEDKILKYGTIRYNMKSDQNIVYLSQCIIWPYKYYFELYKISNSYYIQTYDMYEKRIIKNTKIFCLYDGLLEYSYKLNLVMLYTGEKLHFYNPSGDFIQQINLFGRNIHSSTFNNLYVVQMVQKAKRYIIKCYSWFDSSQAPDQWSSCLKNPIPRTCVVDQDYGSGNL